MGFTGAINAETRKWIGNIVPAFKDTFVVVGCSGNFTVEQIIGRHTRPRHLWGNDVSLYSSALGSYLAGEKFFLEIRDPAFSFLEPFIQDTESKAATILILNEALQYESGKNPHKVRLWQHYRDNLEHYHHKTVEKIRQRKSLFTLHQYSCLDIGELLERIPDESIVIAFMPTYAGGYERLYKRLQEIFTWNKPTYDVLDEERKASILSRMREFSYLYIDDQKRDDFPMAAMVEKRGYKSVYLYSNLELDKKSFIRNRSRYEVSTYKTLMEDDEITRESKITLIRTKNSVINYYRNMYLKKGIEYADGNDCFLIFIDGKLFGFLIFVPSKFGQESIYMQADFVIPVATYPRLSKLLLLVSRSDAVREALEEKYLINIPSIMTTAFTERPVSMKYRGVYKLQSRKEDPPRLNYVAETGTHKLEEIVPLWLKKYHKKK